MDYLWPWQSPDLPELDLAINTQVSSSAEWLL